MDTNAGLAPRDAIVGRESELDTIETVFAGPAPAAVVIEGEPGIGKTTLWRAAMAAARARFSRVLKAEAAASEAQLAFTVLSDLIGNAVGGLMRGLPLPQRRALESALLLGEVEEEASSPRAIAAALASILRLLTAERTLVVAIDDVQWVDEPSRAALAFAVRRLGDRPVFFVLSRRVERDEPAPLELARVLPPGRLTRLPIGPMGLGPLRELVRSRLGLRFPRPTLRRLVEVAGGNPFFMLELARAADRRGATGESIWPLPVPHTLQDLLSDRLAALPRETQEALLVAALAAQPTDELIARALGGDPCERLRPAVEAEVIELERGRIGFAHPLLASVTEAMADAQQLQKAHRQLAEVAVGTLERARHLGRVVDRPDSSVAAALEAASGELRRRGVPGEAAELVERAARLTPPEQQADLRRRLLSAADYHLDGGTVLRAGTLVEEVIGLLPAGPARAEALLRLAQIQVFEGGYETAANALTRAAEEAGDHLAVRAEIELERAWKCAMGREGLDDAHAHAIAALALAEQADEQRLLAQAFATAAFVDFVRGAGLREELIWRAVELEREIDWPPTALVDRPSWTHALLLFWLGRHAEAQKILERLNAENIDKGFEIEAPYVLNYLSRIALLTGDWTNARALADEALEASLESLQSSEHVFVLSTRSLIDAHTGDVDVARERIRHGLDLASRLAMKAASDEFRSNLGFLEWSLGNASAAVETLLPLAHEISRDRVQEPTILRLHGNAIEALIALARLDEAQGLCTELADAESTGCRWTFLTAARCRGLLQAARGDTRASVRTLEHAVELAELAGEPFEVARSLLALGAAQRRGNRRRASRESLEASLTIFEGLPAPLWAQRARSELARIGGRAPASGELTQAEGRVAQLAAAGRSNREIAAELVVTVRTVETHLTHVYGKLGVRSRAELAAKVAADPAAIQQ